MRYLFTVLITFLPLTVNTASVPIQLAVNLQDDININEYLVSEKLDGVRGYWTGKKMLTRAGNPIRLPTWFTESFPDYPLDGELWAGRGTFEQVSSAVRTKKIKNEQWFDVRYMVFDLPASTEPFHQRYQYMKQELGSLSPYLKVISQTSYGHMEEISVVLEYVVNTGGEGLMLHHKNALYKVGRSKNILKLKPYFDADARVIGIISGKGKYNGMLGSLLVENKEGKTFKIGSGFSDSERALPPKIGSIITYQYRGFTANGVPRFATFLRIKTPSNEEYQ